MPIHVESALLITQLPVECIEDCSAPGPVDDAVTYWRERLGFTVNRDRAISALEAYDAWDAATLAAKSDQDLAEIVLWIACGDFAEYRVSPETGGSDVFILD